MNPSLTIICDGIKDTLEHAAGLNRSESLDELTEDYVDLPLLQVYPRMGNTDAFTRTNQTTFRGGNRTSAVTIFADVIASRRNFIDENMAKAAEMVEAIEAILDNENLSPYFGVERIRNFSWSWEILTLQTGQGDSAASYYAARFVIPVRLG